MLLLLWYSLKLRHRGCVVDMSPGADHGQFSVVWPIVAFCNGLFWIKNLITKEVKVTLISE